jgi:hypothetical protein
MIKFICHKKIILKVIDLTGWGYLGKNKASRFISSFFWTKFKNLMSNLAHRFDQTKQPR